jgi:cell filamentation protein
VPPKRRISGLKYRAEGVNDFQPGSRGRVLRNKLFITSVRKMEDAEMVAYIKADVALIEKYSEDHTFKVEDINHINSVFLGEIYDWAGKFRNVNVSKGGFPFFSAKVIPAAMLELERKVLSVHSPCRPGNPEDIARHIAEVHAELLLIHPYREGNGRTARLLATLMAYQADLPGLDFGFIGSRGKTFNQYVAAIQAGLDHNYDAMTGIILKTIKRALRKSS